MILLHANYDLVGFSDGSWFINQNGHIKVGIWGIVLDKDNNQIYLSSGPSEAKTTLEAELQACCHLIKEIKKNSSYLGHKLIIVLILMSSKKKFSRLKITIGPLLMLISHFVIEILI